VCGFSQCLIGLADDVRRSVIVAFAVSAVLNAALLGLYRGDWMQAAVAIMIALWIGGFSFVLAAVFYLLGLGRPAERRAAPTIVIMGIVAVSGLLSLVPGRWLASHDIEAAKRYAESIIPQLETYKRANGPYLPICPASTSIRTRRGWCATRTPCGIGPTAHSFTSISAIRAGCSTASGTTARRGRGRRGTDARGFRFGDRDWRTRSTRDVLWLANPQSLIPNPQSPLGQARCICVTS
jgi:type II secretory pathway pseudopilin PulG